VSWNGQKWSVVKTEAVGYNAMMLQLEAEGKQGGRFEGQLDANDLWHVTLRIEVMNKCV
jgi:hypothetical protein